MVPRFRMTLVFSEFLLTGPSCSSFSWLSLGDSRMSSSHIACRLVNCLRTHAQDGETVETDKADEAESATENVPDPA